MSKRSSTLMSVNDTERKFLLKFSERMKTKVSKKDMRDCQVCALEKYRHEVEAKNLVLMDELVNEAVDADYGVKERRK